MTTKTQKVGIGAAVGGLVLVIIGAAVGGWLLKQNIKVGAAPSNGAWDLLTGLFGGGGAISITGLITALISWFLNRNKATPQPFDFSQIFTTPQPAPAPQPQLIDQSKLPINLQGATGPELIELTDAFFAFMRDRNNVPNQKRLLIALTGVADVIPNFKAGIEGDELVFRMKLSLLAEVKPVQATAVSPSESSAIRGIAP